MPQVSLVVCLHGERDFLERLLNKSAGLYDDLVVVHDGSEEKDVKEISPLALPESSAIDFAELDPTSPIPNGYREAKETPQSGGIYHLVAQRGGRFFQGPRFFQQEPHWPFAWSRARYDWILRLDADEFPSEEMKTWLRAFRGRANIPSDISGYTCTWPLWDGTKAVTQHWPAGRNFLFRRSRVRFFGMAEQVPIADGRWEALPFSLCHQPRRKSYGLRNIIIRKQGGRWRRLIAISLLRSPNDLPRWRWSANEWPHFWQRLREHPIRSGSYFLFRNFLATLRNLWRTEHKFMPAMAFSTPFHHLLIGLSVARMKRERSHQR